MTRTLLDWTIEHNRELTIMRANTESWLRRGLLKSPSQVKVRANKAMSANPGAKVRKAK